MTGIRAEIELLTSLIWRGNGTYLQHLVSASVLFQGDTVFIETVMRLDDWEILGW
jgi:hypothetical protein